MSDTVKLIIEIPKNYYKVLTESEIIMTSPRSGKTFMSVIYSAIAHGIPLDNNSERAETQAYFAGEAYGWEQGRKALIDDLKTEIEASKWTDRDFRFERNALASGLEKAIEIIDNIGKAESED